MLNYLSADYELIEVLGAEADMVNVWQSHDCPQYAIAIGVEEDIWEVIIPRSHIPALENFLRGGRVDSYVNRHYDPCRPRAAEIQIHGIGVAAILARRRFEKRVEGNFGPFVSSFYRHYVKKNGIILL
jgi:hypothetical protein